MAGQVKHKQIFSSIRPDWRLAKLLLNLRTRNTDMLLGAVAKVLGDEGIELISSTAFLEPLLAAGRRADGARARRTRKSARTSSTDWAWRGPWRDSTLARRWWWRRRPAWPSRPWKAPTRPSSAPGADADDGEVDGEDGDGSPASTLERRLTVVKVAKPNQDMRFDVPVIGMATVETMIRAGASCLSVEAGRTLLFDREALLKRADGGRDCHCGGSALILIAGNPEAESLRSRPPFPVHINRRSLMKKISFLCSRRGTGACGCFIRHRSCRRRDDARRGPGCAHIHAALAGRARRFR